MANGNCIPLSRADDMKNLSKKNALKQSKRSKNLNMFVLNDMFIRHRKVIIARLATYDKITQLK